MKSFIVYLLIALVLFLIIVPKVQGHHNRTAKSNKTIICKIFGKKYCRQALRVSYCESRWHTTAKNGQYLGLFQMGYNERKIYGHGKSAKKQTLSARRYFRASGKDWSPWTCKP